MDLKQSVVLQKRGIAQIPAWDRDANTAAAGVQASHNVAFPSLKAFPPPPLPLHTSSLNHRINSNCSWRNKAARGGAGMGMGTSAPGCPSPYAWSQPREWEPSGAGPACSGGGSSQKPASGERKRKEKRNEEKKRKSKQSHAEQR